MMNKNAKVTVKKEGGTIVVTAKIPSLQPRKGVEPVRYDLTDARAAAIDKYGKNVGSLTSSPSVVLENRPRTNVLAGSWTFEWVTSTVPTRSTKPASRSSKPRTRTRRTRNTSTTTDTE